MVKSLLTFFLLSNDNLSPDWFGSHSPLCLGKSFSTSQFLHDAYNHFFCPGLPLPCSIHLPDWLGSHSPLCLGKVSVFCYSFIMVHVMNFPFLILSKLMLDVHTISHLWYLHGFLQETMCTTYMPSIVQSIFLPPWFPTGNHMHYIPHYAWDPHDHHAYLPCIPLFKQTFRLVVP